MLCGTLQGVAGVDGPHEVEVLGGAVRADDLAAVVAVEAQPLVRQQDGRVAVGALQQRETETQTKLRRTSIIQARGRGADEKWSCARVRDRLEIRGREGGAEETR